MVAAPRTWRELASKDLAHLDYREVIKRVENKGDILENLTAGHLASLEPTPQRMAGFIAATPAPGGPDDRLATYRSMRDGSKTPEPVPVDAPALAAGCTVILKPASETDDDLVVTALMGTLITLTCVLVWMSALALMPGRKGNAPLPKRSL